MAHRGYCSGCDKFKTLNDQGQCEKCAAEEAAGGLRKEPRRESLRRKRAEAKQKA